MLRSPINVLIADSRVESLATLVDTLSRVGCIVQAVRSANALLDRIVGIDFDLMVLQLRMAHLDVCDLIRKIRERHSSDTDPSIVVIATDVTPAKVAQLLNAGADRILRTPIALDALSVTVEACSVEKNERSSGNVRLSFERPVLAEGILEIISNQFGENFVGDYVLRACSDAAETIRAIESAGQIGAWREFREGCQSLAHIGASLGAERFVRASSGARQLEIWRLPTAWRFALDSMRCQLDLLNAVLIRRAYC
jgi:two-component system, sensor histidine kinase RpfC